MKLKRPVVSAFIGCGLFLTAGAVHAANICVNNTSFTGGAPGDCSATCGGAGNCDIRDAVAKADLDEAPDTIIFDATVFPSGAQTDIITTSEITLNTPVIIQGPGSDSLVIDNDGNGFNIFRIDPSSSPSEGPFTLSGMKLINGLRGVRADSYKQDVTLDALVIEDNSTSGPDGAGIRVDNDNGVTGTVHIRNCVIINNHAEDGLGGGIEIEDESVVEIANSFILENSTSDSAADVAEENGGGIAVTGESQLTVTDSLIARNVADDRGGGIFVDSGSKLTVTDSVISENSTAGTGADDDGGGIMLFNDNGTLVTQADITGTSIIGNSANDDGGGIATDGGATLAKTQVILNLTDSTLFDNEAVNDDGGGINNLEATATITNTTLAQNRATDGGGINNEFRAGLVINGSTLYRNLATSDGGGLNNRDTLSSVEITNSTLSENFAETDGGGINNENDFSNTVTLLNVTITGNIADADFGGAGGGGGIEQKFNAGTLTITNSILAGNRDSDGAPDCETNGTIISSGGNNLIGTDQGCSDNSFDAAAKNDQFGTLGSEIDPLLGSLIPANGGDPANGIATAVHEPLTGSPAIDGVDTAIAAAPATDQRSVNRPIGASADIGAVEAGCGDGVVNLGEACDDGGESVTCNANCTTSACGDGVVNASDGETCDDGNTTAGDGCSATCMAEACGNGVLDSGETCEDGNTTNGDGCSSTCQFETSGGTGGTAGTSGGDGGDGGDGGGCSLIR